MRERGAQYAPGVRSDEERARARARELAAESVAAGDATGWFERLYAEAEAGVTAARRQHPGSPVRYLTADLLDLPPDWAGAFDLVAELYTVQPLYGPARERALAALHVPVAPGGTLLVIARATDQEDPPRDPGLMPWPLTRGELDAARGPLRAHRVERFIDGEDPPKSRWRAEFRHG